MSGSKRSLQKERVAKATFRSFEALREVAGIPEEERGRQAQLREVTNNQTETTPTAETLPEEQSEPAVRPLFPARQERQPIPEGKVAVRTCSIGWDFMFSEDFYPPEFPNIICPKVIVQRVWESEYGWPTEKMVVRLENLHSHDRGWKVVEGLRCGYPCILGDHWYVLVVEFDGKLLVPPPGTWPVNLPSQVKKGKVVPDDAWKDIFEVNRNYLSWVSTGGHELPGFTTIHIHGLDWVVHESPQGVGDLLRKTCKGRYEIDHDRLTAKIWVPEKDKGYWIGKDGRVVSHLKGLLGVNHIFVEGDSGLKDFLDRDPVVITTKH